MAPDETSPNSGRVWYLGLGANVGDRARQLRRALAALGALRGTRVLRASSVHETDAWGEVEQDPFLNMVAEVKRIERELGRVARHRWGPREIDIDLLVSGDLRVETPELTVPHPLLLERQFVLVPLAELAPTLRLGGNRPVAEYVTHDGSVRPYSAPPL